MEDSGVDQRYQTSRRNLGDYVKKAFEGIRDDTRIGFALLAMISIAAGVYWYRGATEIPAAPQGESSVAAHNEPTTSTAVASATLAASASTVTVHVAGAVRSPGVVIVPAGSRVVDALDAAGGPLAKADLDRLNLAAPIADGDRVLVARLGDPVSGAPITNSNGGSTNPATPAIINLNTATALDLEVLPGIGPTLAAAIITERESRGGFTEVADLRSVHGIGDSRYADIAELVTV